MTLIRLLTLASLSGWVVTPAVAPHYRAGLMGEVADWRGLERVDCMVSSPTVGINEWVYVWGLNTGALRYCKVVDTSEDIDRARHIRTGRRVEFSRDIAIIMCGIENIDNPPEYCPVWVISEY
jgi:hypothetical protein